MTKVKHKTERLHALDSLRAIMMMLGIVLHSANTYVVADYGASWPLKDANSTGLTMDWISSFVHAFRMPIFFVVAGFFAALLFYERSYTKMIKNRINRILLPLLVFVVLLWPLVMIAFAYSNLVISGDPTPFASALASLNEFIPQRTMHLWFLYYLVLFSATSYLLGLAFNKTPKLSHKITSIFNVIIQYLSFLNSGIFGKLINRFTKLHIFHKLWMSIHTTKDSKFHCWSISKINS